MSKLFQRFKSSKKFRIILLLLVLIVGFFYISMLRPAQAAFGQAKNIYQQLEILKKDVKEQDLTKLKGDVSIIHEQFLLFEGNLKKFSYWRFVPHFRFYYQDALHLTRVGILGSEAAAILVDAAEPFGSLLGLGTTEIRNVPAEEKLQQLVMIMPQLTPAIDLALEKLRLMVPELTSLHPDLYPEEFKGIKIRGELVNLQSQIANLNTTIADIKPLLTALPQALGQPQPKTYLLLFQNDKELRPTGGFLTAYALVRFEQGRFKIIKSEDIYQLGPDLAILPAPAPILRYLKVPAWYLRDTNFSPDFKESMQIFEQYYSRIGSPAVDGIIALDTQLLESFFKILGAVEVPEYSVDFTKVYRVPDSCRAGGGSFTAENVVCRLEAYAELLDTGSADRKAVLGYLMEHLVDKILESQPNLWPNLIANTLDQANQKHLLFYLHDETLQALIEKYNFAGRIQKVGYDYLHVNDANLAGLKSDLYMKKSAAQEISIADDGIVTKKLTLTYENTGTYDGWLNSTARNYVRVYTPLGSKLISASGGEAAVNTFEDLGYTVYDNFVLTRPLSSSTLTFEYTLPFKKEKKPGFGLTDYKLLIQKQPGLESVHSVVGIEGQKEEFELTEDREFEFKL